MIVLLPGAPNIDPWSPREGPNKYGSQIPNLTLGPARGDADGDANWRAAGAAAFAFGGAAHDARDHDHPQEMRSDCPEIELVKFPQT